ncbi:MAG: hypothetical protein ACR2MN_06540 [Acidimicrobiales bacterium]
MAVRGLIRWETDDAHHQVAADPTTALKALYAAKVAVKETTRYVVRDAGETRDEIARRLHLKTSATRDRYRPAGHERLRQVSAGRRG